MELRIAVLSDLHAIGHSENDSGTSYLRANPSPSEPNLFEDLQDTIKKNGIKADLVICPGDICDRGDQIGFTFAWKNLHDLVPIFEAKELIATCGNHDLDSRYASTSAHEDPDPKGALLQANPPFPFGDHDDTDRFWSRNFVIRQPLPGVNVIILNTSAYHGGANGELEHGRVSSRTIKSIVDKLANMAPAEINILVCHHHLQPHLAWSSSSIDTEYVKKGVDLLVALTEQTRKTWLVIHGHRHIPQIVVSTSPSYTALGAASFSRIGDQFSNQFHLIKLISEPASPHMPLGGEIMTWNWSRAKKWAQYHDPTRGLPPICGFGYSGGIQYLSEQAKKALGAKPFLDWDELILAVPEVKFLPPEKIESFRNELRINGMNVLMTDDGIPKQIGKTT
ncbi:MAG: metallophosphoesterase [Burkholderiales bacterium]|nr:metallophosphoesterase [Burkholderiales bacterium]